MKKILILAMLLTGCTHYYKVNPSKINDKEYAMDCSGVRTQTTSLADRDLPRGCIYIKRQEVKSEPLEVRKELLQ